ncbi:MAG: hypothetical protein HY890_03660 [Deltaproteobacteria bacterium]|nr:hypothetical protein [Deltaproteobacteria bacterium]
MSGSLLASAAIVIIQLTGLLVVVVKGFMSLERRLTTIETVLRVCPQNQTASPQPQPRNLPRQQCNGA